MKEEKLLNHVISRLEPQILDYVEVRHPQTTSNLLQIIDKYEERFLNRRIRGSSQEFRDANQSVRNRLPNRNRQENWRKTREESRLGARVQYDKARGTRTTCSKGHSVAEERPVRSRQATAVRPCPYYLTSRLKEPEGIPEEHWDQQSTVEQSQEKGPQHESLRRRSGG
ncbi:uncharacterized protein TNCV_1731621 [Trichonephila clavipes]|nr:uncharacterized protein TNCV_1731621 [Trichonephila clavipes]